MALSLKTKRNCEANDKAAPLLNRIIAAGAGPQILAGMGPGAGLGPAAPPTEYERYREGEQWSRLRHDLSKDLVLTFGEDDVRVFKRPALRPVRLVVMETQEAPASAKGAAPRRRERVDVSGLATMPLSEDFRTLRAPPTVLAADAQKKADKALEDKRRENMQRIERDLGGAGKATDDARTPTQSPTKRSPKAALSPTSATGPTFIPPKTWQLWVHRRCRERDPNGSTAFLDGLRAAEAQAEAEKKDPKRRRRRHHRLTCIYHPRSTSNVARSLAHQTLFPRESLHVSASRLIHAIHGASSATASTEEAPSALDDFFPRSNLTTPAAIGDSKHTLQGQRPREDSVNVSFIPTDPSMSELDDRAAAAAMQSSAIFNMTQPILASRCQTPNLLPFEKAAERRARGPLDECECSDRSTDDEADIKTVLENERQAQQVGRPPTPAVGATGLKKLSGPPEPLIADHAARALQNWRDQFRKVKIDARSALASRLRDREETRGFVTSERGHLHLVAKLAEKTGGAFSLCRQSRLTTPAGASMWDPVFRTVEGDRRYLHSTQERFLAFADFCTSKGFPSTDAECAFLDELREVCVADAGQRPSSRAFMEELTHRRSASRSSSRLSATSTAAGVGAPRLQTMDTSLNASSKSAHTAADRLGQRSLFVMRRERSPTAGDGHETTVFAESLAQRLLQRHGRALVATKAGLQVADHLRETCGMQLRDFLMLITTNEGRWGPIHPEYQLIKKRLQAQA